VRAPAKEADAEIRASINEGEAGVAALYAFSGPSFLHLPAGPGGFWDEAHSPGFIFIAHEPMNESNL